MLHQPPYLYFLSLNGLLWTWELISTSFLQCRIVLGVRASASGDSLVAPSVTVLRIKATSAAPLNRSERQMQQVSVGLSCLWENISMNVCMYIYLHIHSVFCFSPRSLQAFPQAAFPGVPADRQSWCNTSFPICFEISRYSGWPSTKGKC